MVIFTWIRQLVWGGIAWNVCLCWRLMIWTIGIITLPFRAWSALHREKSVQNLRIKNRELRKIQGKGSWDSTSRGDTKEAQIQTPSTHSGTSFTFEGVPTRKVSRERETRNKARPNPTGLADPVTPLLFSNTVNPEEALYQRRDVALSQSLFSALLSLLVGTVAYEARDPCMPLVVALFIVAGMSLKSVVHFFSNMRNKLASDAVALLSFNWFILGTLTRLSLEWPGGCSLLSRA